MDNERAQRHAWGMLKGSGRISNINSSSTTTRLHRRPRPRCVFPSPPRHHAPAVSKDLDVDGDGDVVAEQALLFLAHYARGPAIRGASRGGSRRSRSDGLTLPPAEESMLLFRRSSWRCDVVLGQVPLRYEK